MTAEHKAKYYMTALFFTIAGIILDQWSKYMAVLYLKGQEPIELIPGVFQLCYLENEGAAFGVLQGKQFFFYAITVLILCGIAVFYAYLPRGKKFLPLRICCMMIASGAAGNLIDRVRLRYVVDFFYFELIDFPIFNVADIFVTVSAVLLAVLILFYYKEDDLEQIFHSGRWRRNKN